MHDFGDFFILPAFGDQLQDLPVKPRGDLGASSCVHRSLL